MRSNLALYIIKRLGITFGLLIVISIIIFLIVQQMPGDAVDILLGGLSEQSFDMHTIAALRKQYGLDLPPYVQYMKWLRGLIHGDLGTSLLYNRPITPIILNRLEASLILAVPACILMIVLGLSLGVFAAVNENKFVDHLISFASLTGISIPTFLTGSIFIYIFAVKLRFIPAVFNTVDLDTLSLTQKISYFFKVLIFPCITLSLEIVAHVARHTRASMIEEMKKYYFRTAILKGLPFWKVVWKHGFRNALLPSITIIAINVGYIIAGVVVVEMVFAYPGIGNLVTTAIINRDVPLILSGVFVVSATYILANLVADVLYVLLNPRIRY